MQIFHPSRDFGGKKGSCDGLTDTVTNVAYYGGKKQDVATDVRCVAL